MTPPAKRKEAGTAAASKRAAARAETNGGRKAIDFRGLELVLPPKLSGALYFDLAELQEDEGNVAAQVALLRSLIGPEQVRAVRAKVVEADVSFDDIEDVLLELFNDILGAYGSSAGESKASPKS